MVSGQGEDEEGANVLNVIIWVEGAVLEYEPRCVAKTPWKISTTYRHAGGGARIPIRRKIFRCKQYEGYVLGGVDAKKGVDVFSEGGGEVIIRKRQDAVLALCDQF